MGYTRICTTDAKILINYNSVYLPSRAGWHEPLTSIYGVHTVLRREVTPGLEVETMCFLDSVRRCLHFVVY